MNTSKLLHLPGFVRFGIQLDLAPQWPWLALQALALWPTWVWMGRHLLDHGVNQLSAVAVFLLGVTAWRHRQRLRAAPGLGWLALGAVGSTMACLTQTLGAPQLSNWLAVIAAGATLQGFLRPILPRRALQVQAPCTPTAGHHGHGLPTTAFEQLFGNTFANRVCHKAAFALIMLALIAWGLARGV